MGPQGKPEPPQGPLRAAQGITITITEKEAAIIGLGLAAITLDGVVEPVDALRLYDKIIKASDRKDSLLACMPPDVRARWEQRNSGKG